MPCSEHAVAAVVVKDGTMGRDDPRATSSQSHVGIHRGCRIKIHEACLQISHQVSLVAEHRRFAQFVDQCLKALLRFIDGLEETRVGSEEARNGCVIKPGGAAQALPSA